MNVNKFYKDGYDEWQMPSHLAAAIWGQLLSENWNNHISYKAVPEWSINNSSKSQEDHQRLH